MTTALSAIAEIYYLGKLINEPAPVTGGRSHKIWKITTQQGEFAVKQLLINGNAEQFVNLRNIEHLTTRLVERSFPALVALQHQGEPICILDNDYYAVYPWIKGCNIEPAALQMPQVQRIGQLLKKLHDMSLPDIKLLPASYTMVTAEDWRRLAVAARQCGLSFAQHLFEQLQVIIQLDESGAAAFSRLTAARVISHGDLDPYNILWCDSQTFSIIDWELAHFAPAIVDYAATLLYWSVVDCQTLDLDRVKAFCTGYGALDYSAAQLAEAFYIVLGQWLKWFKFNVERILAVETDEPMKAVSLCESNKTFTTIMYLLPLITRLADEIIAG